MNIAIGTYEHTRALKDGSVASARLPLEFVDVSPITRAFRQMASHQAYDISEMALCTYMLARVLGQPIVALPIVLVSSPVLGSLVTSASSSPTDPAELNGKVLGVRSYTQTTGVWVRGVLQDEFGVDLGSLRWLTTEGAHLDAFRDPPNVSRASAPLDELLRQGSIAAAVGVQPSDGIRRLLPDAAAKEAAWSDRTGVRPVNHVVAIKTELWLLRDDIIDLFERARAGDGASVPPIGIEPSRAAFETLTRYAYEQGITPRKLSVDELFEPEP